MSATVDPTTFRKTIGLFATGVAVTAAEVGGEIHAMTANAITSLSLNPLMLLLCVGKKARMATFLDEAAGFSINFLRKEQQALSTFFAGGWKETATPPFRFVPWEGVPRLEGCLAAIQCETTEVLEGGDHQIYLGLVRSIFQGIEPYHPLIFFRGRYAKLAPELESEAPDLGWVETPIQVFYDPWIQE